MAKIELHQVGSNQNTVTISGIFHPITLHFSYNTCIAFSTATTGLIVHKNDWSTTTGKFLNQLDGGNKKDRVDSKTFEELFDAALSQIMVSGNPLKIVNWEDMQHNQWTEDTDA